MPVLSTLGGEIHSAAPKKYRVPRTHKGSVVPTFITLSYPPVGPA